MLQASAAVIPPASSSGAGAGTASNGDVHAAAVPFHENFLDDGTTPSSGPSLGVSGTCSNATHQPEPDRAKAQALQTLLRRCEMIHVRPGR